MTVKDKAAGVAVAALAPEAELGKVAAGKAAGSAAGKAAGSAKTSTAAKQRQQIDAIKAARPPAGDAGVPAPPPATQQQAPSPAPTSPGAGLSLPGLPAAAGTGSGFLLGVFAWALGLAYLRGGSAEVKKFMAAKFLNRVASS